ncbi:hypothetical protein NDU88_009513 [Pleurodeles waltl]|uniref:Uncharacterized protein n=1 Tax=Pleurodeles waltl TaxID=8319 RepID=A0AAV7PTG7_PLEWA|nr:hypothetical protein NDU88_009513 [Pleurodeles waltl]
MLLRPMLDEELGVQDLELYFAVAQLQWPMCRLAGDGTVEGRVIQADLKGTDVLEWLLLPEGPAIGMGRTTCSFVFDI